MAAPLQHQMHGRPGPTLAELQAELREVRAVVFALAHQMAGNSVAPQACLRAVLDRVAPLPVEPQVDQAE